MADVLESKRDATRFRILVEIADRQPAVSQGEIADAVGVTSQAVSEYMRELVRDGFVEKEARSRYRVTNEGVDWLLKETNGIQQYADRVMEDVIGSVHVDAAIADGDIEAGDAVSLSIVDGLLHAAPNRDGPATGKATAASVAGGDVGVTDFEGVIDLAAGRVTILQAPSVRTGGSDAIDIGGLRAETEDAFVVASGVEAVVALERADVEPVTWFAAGAVAADAASRGEDVVVVTTADGITRVTDVLRDRGLEYEIRDL